MKRLLLLVFAVLSMLPSSDFKAKTFEVVITDMYSENCHWKSAPYQYTEYDFTLVIEYEDPMDEDPCCHLWSQQPGQGWADLGCEYGITKTRINADTWRITFECDAMANVCTNWKAQMISGSSTSNYVTIQTCFPQD